MNQRKNDIPNTPPVQAVSAELYQNASCGLSRKEARSRYRAIGRNTLFDHDSARKKAFWLAIFKDSSVLFFLFLVLLAFLFAPLPIGLLALFGFACSVFYPLLIRRTVNRNEELFDRFRMPRVGVIRDGNLQSVRADHIVFGDLLSLKAGDIVPADCRLIASDCLRVLDVRRDENGKLLRRAVTKRAVSQELIGRSVDFDRSEELLRGVSEILEGEALAVVIATGEDTCWRRERCGESPSEHHRSGVGDGCVGRAANSALALYTLSLFVAFFLFLIIRVLFCKSDEFGLVSIFLSLGAMICIGAPTRLRSLLDSFETKWREARIKSDDPNERVVLKSNQAVDRLVELTDLFITGREALALLQTDASSKNGFLEVLKACCEHGIRLSVFLDEDLGELSALQSVASSLCLTKEAIGSEKRADLPEYIEKYRVFCGFGHEDTIKLALYLRQQKRRVAVIGDREKDIELFSVGSLSVGVADVFDILNDSRQNDKSMQKKMTESPPSLLRHADILVAPTDKTGGSVACMLSLIRDARLIVSKGKAAFDFLALSQLTALSFVFLSCVFGLALPTAFYLLFGMGLLETVGILWISSLAQSDWSNNSGRLGQRRLLKGIIDPSVWVPIIAPSLLCCIVILVLRALNVVSLDRAGVFLFCSLLLLQICALLLSVLQEGFVISNVRFLLPIAAVMLPILILSAFCVAFRDFDLLLKLGDWNAVTLGLLPLAPISCFFARYLFAVFFYRTAK